MRRNLRPMICVDVDRVTMTRPGRPLFTDVSLTLSTGDRLGIVTKQGNNIYPDRQMVLCARDVLTRVPVGTIIFDVKCSQQLAPAIEAAGGVPLMYKTGHSLIKAKMGEIGAPISGEMSGHIFFGERWYGFDDATYTAARMLEILSRSKDPSAVLDALPTSFSTPELNVECAEGEPPRVVAASRPRRPPFVPAVRAPDPAP